MTTCADEKAVLDHVEYDSQQTELKEGPHAVAHAHVNIHDAAAKGHVATDEKGNPLVYIDQAASHKLALKVGRAWLLATLPTSSPAPDCPDRSVDNPRCLHPG